MVDILTTIFEIFVFLSKIAVILVAPVVVAVDAFWRFKAHYGKRTFLQFYTRHARAETETEDPTGLFLAKGTAMLVWMGFFVTLFFG